MMTCSTGIQKRHNALTYELKAKKEETIQGIHLARVPQHVSQRGMRDFFHNAV